MIPRFDFGPFPVLESERLILRQLRDEDADDVMRFKGDYAITRLNGGRPYTDRQQALGLIDRHNSAYDDRQSIVWGMTFKPDDTVIGILGFKYWHRDDYRAAIGYDLAQAYWGRGLMPEAVRRILAFGFSEMALNRVEADANTENLASIRVLQKVGFRSEGVQPQQYFEEGAFHDLALFGLLRRDALRP